VPDKEEQKEERVVTRKRTAHGSTASSRNLCKKILEKLQKSLAKT
jgi:hypothetical protein